MSKQNIAIIRNAASYDFGGGERFPIFLANSLKAQGIDSIIISRSKKLLSFAKDNNLTTTRGWWWKKQNWSSINALAIPVYIIWQGLLLCHYLSTFKKAKVTAVHVQSKDDFIAATYAAKLLKLPVIWTDHADLKHIFQNLSIWYKNPTGKMVYKAARHAQSITVVSKSEQLLINAHLPKESPIRQKISVIYNGVIDQYTHYKWLDHGETFTFLVASRLVEDKGITEVIEAFKRLVIKFPSTKLNLIGDGPDADRFKEQASDVPNIAFLGHQSEPLTHMSQASVFVHPTYHEGFSVALVEASMMQLPIIATNVGGNPEIIINEKTGLLVSVKNIDELHAAMERLIVDEKLRTSLAKNAREQYLDKFQFNTIVEKEFIPLYGEY